MSERNFGAPSLVFDMFNIPRQKFFTMLTLNHLHSSADYISYNVSKNISQNYRIGSFQKLYFYAFSIIVLVVFSISSNPCNAMSGNSAFNVLAKASAFSMSCSFARFFLIRYNVSS